MNTPSVLAIDFGTQRIGLARSFGTLAEPWQILSRNQYPELEDVCNRLAELVDEEQFQQIVVGMSEAEMAQQTQQFITVLRDVVNIPIDVVDETLSSKVVRNKLKEAGRLRKNRRTIDHFAAAEFLQEWLDSQ